MALAFTKALKDVFAEFDASSNPRNIVRSEFERAMREVEAYLGLSVLANNSVVIKNSLADLNADLDHDPDTLGIVFENDTQKVYRKIGANGDGSWLFLQSLVIVDGQDGADGADGQEGEQGEQGIQGEKGDNGEDFHPDAVGTLANRATFNNEASGFSYLDEDNNILYFKLSGASGDWSSGLTFGVVGSAVLIANDRADLITKNSGAAVFLQESGREGIFQYDATITVAVHSLDTEDGVYIAPDSASNGAWVRSDLGAGYNVSWFGAIGDGVANDTTAIQAGIDFLSDVTRGGKLLFDSGIFDIDASLNVLSGGIYFEGQGEGYDGGSDVGRPTIIRNETNTNALFRYGDGGTTVVRGGSISNIRLDCGSDSIGVFLDDLCSHLNFVDMLIDFPTVGFFAGASCFSNTFTRCNVRDYSSVGWDLTNLCHSNTLFECRTTSGQTATGTADVRIGDVGHCSQVNIIGCSFDHWGITRHILVVRGKAINISGNYLEAKDANMVFPIEIGRVDNVDGCNIVGNRILGFDGVSDAIRIRDCNGFFIAGNEFVIIDTACVLNSNANNSGVISANDFSGKPALRHSSLSTKIAVLSGDKVGFYGKLGIEQPAVTGSRGGNAALLSLLNALDDLGLIDNSTSA